MGRPCPIAPPPIDRSGHRVIALGKHARQPLTVLGIVTAYLIRGYLMVRGDNVQMLARKDSERLKLIDSADYAHTFPGTAVRMTDTRGSDRSTATPYHRASIP